MNIPAIIADRFNRWGRFLREQNATPIMVVGLTSGPHSSLVVTTCEEMTDQQIEDTLRSALAMMDRNRRAKRPRPGRN